MSLMSLTCLGPSVFETARHDNRIRLIRGSRNCHDRGPGARLAHACRSPGGIFQHRLDGGCFFALAGYIALDASVDLLKHEAPRVTYFGIIYAAACVIVMPLLARAKRRVAARLNSHALHADSHQSDICAYLSVILLLGLALNALLGWWWADPIAALCMLPTIIREGVAGLRGKICSHAHF